MYYMVALVSALVLVPCCRGFGSGAQPAGCTGLAPVHNGVTPQTSASPYSITVGSDKWDPSRTLTVTLSGNGTAINGFLLQARQKGSTTGIGKFDSSQLPNDTKLGPCKLGDVEISVTHANKNDKGDLVFKWSPADTEYKGDIFFQGAVAQNHDVYWANILSKDIPIVTGGGAYLTAGLSLLMACVLAHLF